jgi:tetratricopeptide (TPR) repeat protein
MARRHLDAETVYRLVARDLDRGELRAAGWHLYKCQRCRGRIRQASEEGERLLAGLLEGIEPVDVYAAREYGDAFSGARRRIAACLEGDRAETVDADTWLAELLRLPAESRRRAVDRHPERASWKVAEGLLLRCQSTWSARPAEAEELGALALRMIDVLRCRGGGPREALLTDLEARAWAYVGNCRRVRDDLRGGARAFDEALAALGRGSRDPAERARVLDLHASLLRAQRRFAASDGALETAIRLYGSVGDQRGVARALIKRAITASTAGEPERAAALDREALALLDEGREPRLFMAASYNLVQDLLEAGRLGEVQALLPEARRLTAAHGEGADRLRFAWFEGILARDVGDAATAEGALLEARQRYVDREAPYEAALVSLDLAVLYAEQGRSAETRRLAEEMLPIFESREIGREALATLMLFQQAALAERLTAGLAREVALAMRHGRSVVPLTNAPVPS